MKKRSFPHTLLIASLLSFLFSLNCISVAAMPSGIIIRDTTASTCNNLNLLCRVWGFVKYYHPFIASDQFDMDAELFDVLPKVIAAKNEKQRNKILADWVTGFGDIRRTWNPYLKEYAILPNNEWMRDESKLGKELSGLLRKIEIAQRAGSSRYVTKDEYGYISFAGEAVYDSIPYSDAGYRLLTLFRFWNSMKYYFPYLHLTDQDWDNVLTTFIPKFMVYTSDANYELLLCELIATLCDSHATITINQKSYPFFRKNKSYDAFRFPIEAQYVNGDLLISTISDSTALTAGFCLGDIIKAVDGVTVEQYFNEAAKYNSHSDRSRLINFFSLFYLSTNKDITPVDLVRQDTSMRILIDTTKLKKFTLVLPDIVQPIAQNGYAFINDSIGYIYPGTMTFEKEDEAMAKFKNTKGIIIDMRCYPQQFFWRTPQHFIADSIWAVVFQKPDYLLPGAFVNNEVSKGLNIYNARDQGITYDGKIIILVNSMTVSQAEYLTMWLQSIPRAVTIGNKTAGTDGDRMYNPLPYKGSGFYFSSIGIIYPDGTITQRKGVKIDKIMNPTPQGLREGRDEILEEAIRMIQQENSAPIY